eukprot:CAMPEP_0206148332 /NCGR_PEP_ID=MMETSP1473-20131121/36319_1 /ASSEMBLY_ACC=CAM_ASM_001109 /TAXON_ID=1461547 /ORGANISM="Stichococcus sp, Strain RCC1054" /LENGTH=71 /DNA_ID=CAMNT_0053545629 /DNA_START=221 /DNA_END=433 /DNA_ORIENTATION=+
MKRKHAAFDSRWTPADNAVDAAPVVSDEAALRILSSLSAAERAPEIATAAPSEPHTAASTASAQFAVPVQR